MHMLYSLSSLVLSILWTIGFDTLDERLRRRSWAEPVASFGVIWALASAAYVLLALSPYLGYLLWPLLLGFLWGILTIVRRN